MATVKQKALWKTISNALDGRSQTWLINKLDEEGVKLNDVTFSRRKHGFMSFTEAEISAMEKILKVKLPR